MQNYRGMSAIPNPARLNGEDIDNTPRQFRRVVDASGLQQIQIHNGLRAGIGRGNRNIPGIPLTGSEPSSFYWGQNNITPIIPGQTRGDVAGFHPRGPSPLNVQQMLLNGPGSQPDNPGGPGQIAGQNLVNPMTG
jgi:hypothetical protein